MSQFEPRLLRLKAALNLSEDREIASLFGMEKSAFAARKRRDAFPDDKLYALALQRPELGIDVDFVLTGVTREAHADLDAMEGKIRRAADAGLESYEDLRSAALRRVDERSLVDRWRLCAPRDQEAIMRIVSSLAAVEVSAHEPVKKVKTG